MKSTEAAKAAVSVYEDALYNARLEGLPYPTGAFIRAVEACSRCGLVYDGVQTRKRSDPAGNQRVIATTAVVLSWPWWAWWAFGAELSPPAMWGIYITGAAIVVALVKTMKQNKS